MLERFGRLAFDGNRTGAPGSFDERSRSICSSIRSLWQIQRDYEHRGGYIYETRIRQTLTGLGFDADDYERPIVQLSGGQRTRAYLARLLLSDQTCSSWMNLTNHLDIAAVEWLEGYLSQWQGATLIVSHDPLFLRQSSRPYLGDEQRRD